MNMHDTTYNSLVVRGRAGPSLRDHLLLPVHGHIRTPDLYNDNVQPTRLPISPHTHGAGW